MPSASSEGTGESDTLAESVRALSALATGELSLSETLTKVATYAVQAIPGAEGAGLTLIAPDRSETLVATTRLVSDVDAIQYGMRQGPCISAAAQGVTVLSGSLGDDERWPEFGAEVALLGVHSALSLPLITPDRVIGAMNIYARPRGAFDEQAATIGQLFAVPAAIAVQNAEVLATVRLLAQKLQHALDARVSIDQAIGVMISQYGVSADDAFLRLQQLSRRRHESIQHVARVTVDKAVARGPVQSLTMDIEG